MKVHYSPEFPQLLDQLQCTLALSTYQSGVVILISSIKGVHLNQFAKKLRRPMGIALDSDGTLAVACKNTVEVFGQHRQLALRYKKEPGKYDGMFFPRSTYFTGQIDLHDIEWTEEGLIGVNTAFSCVCAISDRRSFTPLWRPSFVSELLPEDRCHLNGLAVSETGDYYVTLLARTDARQAWRETKLESGMLMVAATEEVLVDGLPMPHSPRLVGQRLYYLLAATGELHVYDLATGTHSRVGTVPGFARGMAIHDDYIFVGTSKIRKTSTSFGDLPIAGQDTRAGVMVFQMSTGQCVAELYYEEKVEEIFDLKVIPNLRNGVILDREGKVTHRAIDVTEELFFWQKEEVKAKS